ncbi:rhombosortase [Paucibacter soli]|uniref:rhombosortase n=1 Tax=Paucibacter soli TaxID=3133433 RepID=UPI0030A74C6E
MPWAAWEAFSAGLALLASLAWWLPRAWLDWQPALCVSEPWRILTGALVHWSAQHLLANLAGCAVLALLGRAGRLRATPAWLAAWPLTQLGLLMQAELLHYGGLSGLLHAGVAVAVVELLARGGHQRWLAAGIGIGLLVKLWLEQPLGPALRSVPGWDIAIAPFAHLSGTLAGALSALSWLAWRRLRASSRHADV